MGEVGSLPPDLQDELVVWRVVQSGVALSEVQKWDLEDLEKFNAVLDLDAAQHTAAEAYLRDRQRRQK